MNWLDRLAVEAFVERLKLHRLEGLEARFMVLGKDEVKLPSSEYFLMRGREVIEHCEIEGGCGQAFTSHARNCVLPFSEVPFLDLSLEVNRALFYSALNALLNRLGEVKGTLHCKGVEAEACGDLLAAEIRKRLRKDDVVLHIGYQPGHVRALAKAFDRLLVTDMDPANIGSVKFGVKVLSSSENEEAIRRARLVLVTGSAVVNGTLHEIINWCDRYAAECIIYGVTGKGVAKLLNLPIFCPYARDQGG